MKKALLILAFALLLTPTICMAEEETKQTLEEQLKGVDLQNIQNGQMIDLRKTEEKPWYKKYLPDMLIIVGAVGAIEATLAVVRNKKNSKSFSK